MERRRMFGPEAPDRVERDQAAFDLAARACGWPYEMGDARRTDRLASSSYTIGNCGAREMHFGLTPRLLAADPQRP